jgi:hypothetical protein
MWGEAAVKPLGAVIGAPLKIQNFGNLTGECGKSGLYCCHPVRVAFCFERKQYGVTQETVRCAGFHGEVGGGSGVRFGFFYFR